MRLIPALALVSVLAVPSAAAAATLKVPSEEFPTVQSAVDAAAEGDWIVVAKGTYNESVVVTGKTGIFIVGKGKPIIDAGDGSAIRIDASTRVFLAGFVLRNGSDHGIDVVDSREIGILKCDIAGFGGDAVRIGSSSQVVVQKCFLHDVEGRGVALETAAGDVSEVLVTKNRISGTGDAGIKVNGSDLIVSKNTLGTIGGDGIRSDAGQPLTGCFVEKNKVAGTGGAGVRLADGTEHLVAKNRLTDLGSDGISVAGTLLGVEKNRIRNAGGNGITVDGTTVGAEKNRISGTGGAGVEVNGCCNRFEKNSVMEAAGDGFRVNSVTNEFVRNKASGSGGTDLDDVTGEGSNIYDRNRFGTESVTGP